MSATESRGARGDLTTQAGILSLGGFVSYSVYIVVPMCLARLMSREDYGQYGQALLVLHLAYGLGRFGLPGSVNYLHPTLPENRRSAFLRRTARLFLLAGCLAAVIVATLAGPLSRAMAEAPMASMLVAGALYLFFLVASDFVGPMLVVTGRVRQAAVLQVAESVGRIGAVLVPAALGLGARGIFGGLAVLLALRLVVAMRLLPARSGAPAGPTVRRQLAYAAPLAGGAALSEAACFGAQVIAMFLFGAEEFAVLMVGLFAIPVATLLKRGTKPILIREFARAGERRILALYGEATRKTALIVFPVAVFTAIHADLIVPALFSEKYLASVPVSRLASLVTLQGAVYYSIVAEGVGKSRVVLELASVQLVVALPLAFLLGDEFGLMGLAGAQIAGLYASGAFGLARTSRILGVGISRVLPWGELARILAASGLTAATVLPLRLLELPALPAAILTGVVFCLVHGAGMLLPTGLLKARDRDWLLGLMHRRPIGVEGAP